VHRTDLGEVGAAPHVSFERAVERDALANLVSSPEPHVLQVGESRLANCVLVVLRAPVQLRELWDDLIQPARISFEPKTRLGVVPSRSTRPVNSERSETCRRSSQYGRFQNYSCGRPATPVLPKTSQRKLLPLRGAAQIRYDSRMFLLMAPHSR
jgi:hypothetical protein